MLKLFLTFFYTGLFPKAPGTMGTIAGAVVAFFLLKAGMWFESLFLITVFISLLGIECINKYEKITNTHDSKYIVIDEVAGIWLTICISLSATFIQVLLCVVFFRIFDIFKPSYIGKIDKNVKGGLGVMGDDLLAGFFAGIFSAVSWQLISKIDIIHQYNF